ncbi:hypothetical protein OIU79_030812 [Salix purpurea]|uniref:Uncharacterized protein n=1 Tax=Salix purpurea TaxID=77065 RepID=A0A9Q0V9D5_SALPP|nr:hypothetical protein OIU79_030812 [Salix purpurea]
MRLKRYKKTLILFVIHCRWRDDKIWRRLLWIKHRNVNARRSICEFLCSHVIKETNMPLYEQVELLMVFLTSLNAYNS